MIDRQKYADVSSCMQSFNICPPVSSAQRSAQELPAVERQDLDRCSVLGGQQMVLTGQNFTSDSKVIFSEKTQGEEIETEQLLVSGHVSCSFSSQMPPVCDGQMQI